MLTLLLAVALALLAGLAAELAGPYLGASFEWWTAQLTWSLVFAGLAFVFGGWLCSQASSMDRSS